MEQFTYKDHFAVIIGYLTFLSDRENCYNSWVEGTGTFSGGYKEELNSIAGYGFFDSFPDKIENFKISKDLKNEILNFIFEFNKLLEKLSKDLSDEEILKNRDWIKLTSKMKNLVEKMKGALGDVSTDSVYKCSYKSEYLRLIRHFELLSNPSVCLRSWLYGDGAFSLGSKMEFYLIETNHFFNITDQYIFQELSLSQEFYQNFIEIRNNLKNFITEHKYKITDLALIENKEWQDITIKLKDFVSVMNDQIKLIPDNILIKSTSC